MRLHIALPVVLAFLASPAHALFEDDEARRAILDLRQRVESNRQASEAADARAAEALRAQQQELQRELARATEDNAQLRRSLLALQGQIDALRAELARVVGQDEQLAREIAELQRRQKDMVQGVDSRLRQFEPVQVSLEGDEFKADPAEKRDFDAAFNKFRQGDFAGSRDGFVELLKRYPSTGYRPSSLFWLGNAHYAERDYKAAISAFSQLLSLNAKHPKAPEAMLALANCQIELKDVRTARKTLTDLQKIYPQSEAAAAAKDRLARLK